MSDQSLIRIFISYGRRDGRELALRLRDDLQARGCSVWFDLQEIEGGADWSEKIEAAIDHCDITIALITPAANESKWCRAEQLRAIRKGKRLIPLLAQAQTDVPFHLEHLNFLNFADTLTYDANFRDLISDLKAWQAFRLLPNQPRVDSASPFKTPHGRVAATVQYAEKSGAATLRQHIHDLRQQAWLGSRFWWTSFLFYFSDIETIAQILQGRELPPPFTLGKNFHNRWDKYVRLYFRPRTPDLFHAEGFRMVEQATNPLYAPIPVYLLFDLEAVVCHPDSRFADGDPVKTDKTFKTAAAFKELPFEQIYHDTWFMSDEREEIMRYREAQVVLPDPLGLESLQVIWLRSAAEYDTLRYLLPPATWHRWQDKITTRSDYHLFNHRRPYVEHAQLSADNILLRFNPCYSAEDCATFQAAATITLADGTSYTWQQADFSPVGDLQLQLPQAQTHYTIEFRLDGDLAYASQSNTNPDIL